MSLDIESVMTCINTLSCSRTNLKFQELLLATKAMGVVDELFRTGFEQILHLVRAWVLGFGSSPPRPWPQMCMFSETVLKEYGHAYFVAA